MKLIFAHSYIYRVHFFQKNIEVRYDYGGTALSIVVDISERPTTNSLNLALSCSLAQNASEHGRMLLVQRMCVCVYCSLFMRLLADKGWNTVN